MICRNAAPRLPFRLAAIDIDDTLVGSDGRISHSNKRAVHHLRRCGVQVVLASGRSYANMLPFHSELGLDGPVVSAQGAVVNGGDGSLWAARCMPEATVRALVIEGRRREASVMQYRKRGVFVERRTRFTEYDQSRNVEPQILVADLLEGDLSQVHKVIWLGEPARIAALWRDADALFGKMATVVNTDPEYLEFLPADSDKAAGVAVVARTLGFGPEQVVAFGDGNNDAPMLAWAGLGVAVGHAKPAAKAAADLVASEGTENRALARAVSLVCRVAQPDGRAEPRRRLKPALHGRE